MAENGIFWIQGLSILDGASEDIFYQILMKNCTNLNIKHQMRNFIGCGFTLFFISIFPKIAILQTIILLIKQPEIHCRNDFFSLVCSYFIFSWDSLKGMSICSLANLEPIVGSFYYVNYGSSIITSKVHQIISVMKM